VRIRRSSQLVRVGLLSPSELYTGRNGLNGRDNPLLSYRRTHRKPKTVKNSAAALSLVIRLGSCYSVGLCHAFVNPHTLGFLFFLILRYFKSVTLVSDV